MIIGITGAICSGKKSFADYLVEMYGFDKVDLLELFKMKLKERGEDYGHSPLKRREEAIEETDDDDLPNKLE